MSSIPDKITYLQIRIHDLFANACETGNIQEVKRIYNENPQIDLTFDNNILFVSACANNHIHVAEFLLSVDDSHNPIDIMVNNLEPFRSSTYFGHYQMSKWLYHIMTQQYDQHIVDKMICAKNNEIFRLVCREGHLMIAQWLFEIIPSINLSANENESFRWGCCNGDLEMVVWLYDNVKNINITMFENYLFRNICKFGHLNIIKWMLDLPNIQINISEKSNEAVKNACEKGHLEIVKLLYHEKLKTTPFSNYDLLIFFEISVYFGNLPIAEWLWEISDNGNNLNIYDPINLFILENAFEHICEMNYITTVKWLKKNITSIFNNQDITSLFHKVCKNGSFDLVKWLYQNFDNIMLFQNNDMIFKSTCLSGHLSIAQWIYQIYDEKNYQKLNTDRYTLLFKDICKNGHIETAKWIYTQDSNINISVFKNMAFISACENGHIEIVKWLFDKINQNKNQITINFNDIFIKICRNGHHEITEWLYQNFTQQMKNSINNLMGYCFVLACSKGHEKQAKWIYKQYRLNTIKYINQHQFNQAFVDSCSFGFKNIAEWLLYCIPTISIQYNHNEAFKNAVINNHYKVVLWLYTINSSIDISEDNYQLFTIACTEDFFDIAQLLHTAFDIDITINNDFIFRNLCKNNTLEMAMWFQTLLPDRYVLFYDEYGDIQDFNIIRNFEFSDTIVKKNTSQEICPICYENNPNVITDCGHIFCQQCITIMYEKGTDTCSMCRHNIKQYHQIIHPRITILDI